MCYLLLEYYHDICCFILLVSLFVRFCSGLTTASQADFCDITNKLGPNQLQHLFHNLGISQRDIEHAEVSANTSDTRLKARAVLRWWKQTKGRDATREALFEAKRKLSSSTGTPGAGT